MRGIVAAAIAALGLGLASEGDFKITKQKWPTPNRERPIVNLPEQLRQQNWRGPSGQGSCVHASWIMLLRWQGQHAYADYWRKKYGDGEYYDRMASRLDAEGIKWAGTVGKTDVAFLEWAHRTRRGAIVTWSPRHVVCIVHFDDKWAGILDNNQIDRIKWIPRDQFVREWSNRGSWAMTPIYTPPPPIGG